MLEAAGFAVEELGQWPLRLSFRSWLERMQTPEGVGKQIRALFTAAPASVREALRVEEDGTFTVPVVLLQGRRPG
jgi:hypothetical protein